MALTKIAQCLDPTLTAKDPNQSLSLHLHQAQKQLKKACRDAAEHQKRHLEALLNQATALNQQKKSKHFNTWFEQNETINTMPVSANTLNQSQQVA